MYTVEQYYAWTIDPLYYQYITQGWVDSLDILLYHEPLDLKILLHAYDWKELIPNQ